MFDALFNPRSVALIGLEDQPSSTGYAVLRNLIDGGWPGKLIAVGRPDAGSFGPIQGQPVLERLDALDGPIDLALITLPASQVRQAVTDLLGKGVRALIILSSGFKEQGAVGAVLEQEIRDMCRARGVRLQGPNCRGLINTHASLNLTPIDPTRIDATASRSLPRPGGLSILSQSGALCAAMLDRATLSGLGVDKLVSTGNTADLSEGDFLKALGDAPETRLIIGYFESLESGDAFIKAAERVTPTKPVMVLKAGMSRAGRRAAASHTGSLLESDIAYGAAFKRAGVIRARSFEELFDLAAAFDSQPLPSGRGVAVVTNAGAAGVMATDAVEEADLLVSEVTTAAAADRPDVLDGLRIANPLHLGINAGPEQYGAAVDWLLETDSTDAVLVQITPQAGLVAEDVARRIGLPDRSRKPLLAVLIGGRSLDPAREVFCRHGIPHYPSPARAVAALRAMAEYAAWRRRKPRVVTRFPVNRRRVRRILNRIRRQGLTHVGEVESKEILRAYDFNVPAGRLALSADEAIETARRVGYPVAMKIVSPAIPHKTEVGGVRTGLHSDAALRDAFDLMMLRIPRLRPEAPITGVYVERMAAEGREVILGMTRDKQFGPLLMFGLGGIFVEVMKDVTFYLAPITSDEAMQMLESTRSFSLLRGIRGGSAVDVELIARGLQRISQLATDFPQIQELDINPFIVGPPGGESCVADARMVVRTEDAEE